MAHPQSPNPRRIRVGWVATTLVLLAIGFGAGYFTYQRQKVRNTQRLLQDAHQARLAGNIDRAIESYSLYLERTGSDVDVLRIYASMLYDRLSVSRTWLGPTIRALRDLNRIDPGDEQTLQRLTSVYMDLREFSMAEELCKTWVEISPDKPEAVLALARASHGNNNNEFALKVLSDAANRNPHEPRYYPPLIELLGNVFQRHDEANEWIRSGLENASAAFEVQMAASLYFENRREFDSARHHLECALELAPERSDVLISGASFFIARGQLERAGVLLDRAMKSDPSALGLLTVRRAYAVNSQDRALLISVGNDLQKAGQSGNLALLAQAAELYLRAGAISQADGCIESLESENAAMLPKGTLDSLRGARALMADQPYAAIAPLEAAVRYLPSDTWTLELLARAFLRTGALDEAADLYRRLALLTPSSASPRLALARLEIQNGKFDRARDILASLTSPHGHEAEQAKLLSILVELNQPKRRTRMQLIEELESIAANPPTDLASFEIMIHAFLDAGLSDRALDIWSRKSGDDSIRARIAHDVGRRLIADPTAGDAIEHARRWSRALLDGNSQSIEAALLHCEILIAENRFDEAQKFVEEISTTPEQRGLLWELLGDKWQDPMQQRFALSRAAQLRTADITVRQKLARLLDDLSAARKIVEEMRAIEGEGGIQWKFELASLLLRLDGSPEAATTARSLLRECLDVRSGWVAARGLTGFAHEKLGALSEAVESYRAALALNPDLATHTIAFRLVDTLKRLGRYNEADAALAPIARAMPDSIDVQRLLTEQHARRHDMTSAAVAAEQILNLTPDDPSWAAVTADLLLRAGNAARAEQTARDALARHPDSLTVVTSLAQALLAQGKNDEAQQLTRRFASDKKSAAVDILLARVLVECSRIEDAVKVLDEALIREPGNAELCASVAAFWGAQGNRPRQLEFTRKALTLRGEEPNQSLWLAAFLASGSESERKEATEIVRRRLVAHPNDSDALLLDAQIAVTQEPAEIDRAQTDLIAALRINPRALNAHKMLAAVLIQKGELSAADEAIAAGLMADTDDPDLLVLSAEVQQHRGDFELSMTPLRRLIASPQPPIRAFDLLTTAAIETHQLDQAVDILERLAHRPFEVTVFLARLYESKGNTDKAGELLQQVVEHAPSIGIPAYFLFLARHSDFERIDNLARTHAVNHPDDLPTQMMAAELLASRAPISALRLRGFESLERIAQKHPDSAADARFRAGLAHFQHGDLVNAETMLLNASQLAPLNPKPVNALAWLYGEEMSDPQRGLALLSKFENAGGRHTAEMLDTYGTLLFRIKRFDEALQKLNLCLRMSGQSASRTAALYHLALVQFAIGAPQDAATNLKAALHLHDRVGGLTPRQLEESHRLLQGNVSNRQTW